MTFSFWKKMFGSQANAGTDDQVVPDAPVRGSGDSDLDAIQPGEGADQAEEVEVQESVPSKVTRQGLEDFVLYVARALVDNPDMVTVSTLEKERLSVIQIRCDKPDIGKIIGKSGKTIAALRLLVSGAGGRIGLRMTVDVLD